MEREKIDIIRNKVRERERLELQLGLCQKLCQFSHKILKSSPQRGEGGEGGG